MKTKKITYNYLIKNLEKIMGYVSEDKVEYVVTDKKRPAIRLMPIKQKKTNLESLLRKTRDKNKSSADVQLKDEKKILRQHLIDKHAKNIPGYKYTN